MNVEDSKEQVRGLVEKYNRIVAEGGVSGYNEEMTKKDFILPLFRALGWDTESNEVTAEESISKKRVDYGFRINNIPKFFLEAKSLREDLSNPEFVKQAVNYAWHKGCTWAVLTNFKDIYVFNSEIKGFNPLQIKLFSMNCNEFPEKFNQLMLLSRESFEQGLIDKEAEKWGKKTKKISVDKQLLADFTIFRELLSKNVMKLNQSRNLTESDLDESVQRILDRLIFIRNCEDRELEPKILISNFREWESRGKGQLIKNLRQTFKEFDQKYNSKLFQEHLCDTLEIDNEVLSEIISGLYNTKDMAVSYDFSAIEADVLGNIYEQYLGHILRKTDKRAKLTESHAHRKEQGIYYTPTYIVDYIVRNTLGELLKEKDIDASKIRILDPACGSGSFLIRAFDVLKEYHRQKADKYTQVNYDEILKNNIFGVDLDKQAVEIAQLNLLLKIAEKGHKLPLLEQNIKCGNSLIDDESVAGDKAFKWEKEFKKIMDEGGFDVVVGNPPYVNNVGLPESDKKFYSRYVSAYEQYDILVLFIEKGIKLLRDNGILGFIVSNKFLVSKYGKKLREFLLDNTKILKLTDVSNLAVFRDASTYPVIIICQKSTKDNDNNPVEINSKIKSEGDFITRNYSVNKIMQEEFRKKTDYIFEIHIEEKDKKVLEKISLITKPLEKILDVRKGIETGDDKYFSVPKEKTDLLKSQEKEVLVKLIRSRDIGRYAINWAGNYLIYDTKRLKGPRTKDIFETDKIVTCRTVKRLTFGYDTEGRYLTDTNQILLPKNKDYDIRFVLGILNSRLIDYFYRKKFESSHMRGGYFRCFKQYLDEIPIKIIPETDQQPLIHCVDKILSLNKRLNEIGDKRTDERAKIEEEIKKTDAEIDKLVYEIYGITEEEKRVIEES